jgi:hypothetical protein
VDGIFVGPNTASWLASMDCLDGRGCRQASPDFVRVTCSNYHKRLRLIGHRRHAHPQILCKTNELQAAGGRMRGNCGGCKKRFLSHKIRFIKSTNVCSRLLYSVVPNKVKKITNLEKNLKNTSKFISMYTYRLVQRGRQLYIAIA